MNNKYFTNIINISGLMGLGVFITVGGGILLDRKDAVKDKNNLYGFVRGPDYQAINKVRLQNIEKLSKAISRINNIIFFS